MLNEAQNATPRLEGKLIAAKSWVVGVVSLSLVTILFLALLGLWAVAVALNYPGGGWGLVSGVQAAFLPTPAQIAISRPLTLFPAIPPVKKQQVTLVMLAGGEAVAELPANPSRHSLRDTIPAPLIPPVRLAVETDFSPKLADRLAGQLARPFMPARQPAVPADTTQAARPQTISANSYTLIPLEGQREGRPADMHGDLNLKLRAPQPIEAGLALVEINGSGLDPDAPNLGAIFKPDFVRAYTVHDWDWNCNCQGPLLTAEHLVLVGLRTTPGAPVFIPPRKQNVYAGKYYATLLFASEDSLTFVYTRAGSVARGYTVHYLGLHTDPGLVNLFRQSNGAELPGLTLDTPIGIATAELIVAIRDNGTFLDVRSRHDWWE
jgi:hypothetical protein